MNTAFLQFEEWLMQNAVLEQFNLSQIGVFGSFIRNEKPNDIDLLLEAPIHYTQIDKLKELVTTAWHLPCDIAVKPYIEPIIWHYIQKDVRYVKKQ